MLNLQRFVFNSFYENTYLVWESDLKETVVIDPGCSNEHERTALTSYIETNRLKIKYILNTHCHLDHILGNKFLKETYKADLLAPLNDIFMLETLSEQAKMFGLQSDGSPRPDNFLEELSELKIGNLKITILETPGHTAGEVCIYFEKEKICFTGDVLFNGGIGRTDLVGGNYPMLIKSIKEKLFLLPDDVKIYPGHDAPSTIGDEKNNNPFLH